MINFDARPDLGQHLVGSVPEFGHQYDRSPRRILGRDDNFIPARNEVPDGPAPLDETIRPRALNPMHDHAVSPLVFVPTVRPHASYAYSVVIAPPEAGVGPETDFSPCRTAAFPQGYRTPPVPSRGRRSTRSPSSQSPERRRPNMPLCLPSWTDAISHDDIG